jgi:putative ABC transport system permease protein
MERLRRQTRQAIRSLLRDWGFSAIVVVTLALAIGGNSAIFGVAKVTFHSRLPFPESTRIARLYGAYRNADGSVSEVTIRGREFNVLNAVTTGADGPFASMVGLEDVGATLTGLETPEKLTMLHTTAGWMETLGIHPALGRWFSAEEERQGQESGVAVIADELWRRRFGGDAAVLGRTMTLDDRRYTIIGVMPRGFRFPYNGEVWVPVLTPPDLSRDYGVFARLKPGVTLEDARAALAPASAALMRSFPDTAAGFHFTEATLVENLQADEQGPALALLFIAGFFLLLASVNVANLLLTRSVSRRREEAIRAALGATRQDQIARRLLEGMALAIAGSGLGIAIGLAVSPWLKVLVPSNFIRELGILPNVLEGQVLLMTASIGLLTGAVSGLLAAFTTPRGEGDFLVQASARTGRGRTERRSMDAFVVVQFVLALALITGSALMIQNFRRLTKRDLGIDAAHLLTMEVSTSGAKYATAAGKTQLARELIREIENVPGVSAAGLSTLNPLGRATWWAAVVAQGQEEASQGKSILVNHRLVTPDFFNAMGIPLERGRVFTDDTATEPRVVIVSERMAKKFWPNEDAIGKRIRSNRPGQPWLTVVGIVGNVADYGEPGAPHETWYLPYAQFADSLPAESPTLMVRSAGDPRAVLGAVQQAAWRVDRNLALSNVSTLDRFYLESLAQQRLTAGLISVLAGFGLLLGALGIYGTLSFSVGTRVREIGIRMALGARPMDVQRLTLLAGLRLSAIATVLGIGASWEMGRILASQLSEIRPADPATLLVAAFVLTGAALLAAYIPARRAARVDPLVALRSE